VPYVGRPGLSPALAALIALGRIRKRHRVLDVGCGHGTDALLLARWGFRNVEAIDPDRDAIAVARRKATRWRLGSRVRFQHARAERLTQLFPERSFDVVLHTLVANNLRKDKDRHFREVAAVMDPEGLLLCHERVTRRFENARPDGVRPLPELRRHFDLSPGISTHLAELPSGASGPQYARVVLWLGTPKG